MEKNKINEKLEPYKVLLKAIFIPSCVFGFIKGYSIEQNGQWDPEDKVLYTARKVFMYTITIGVFEAFLFNAYLNRIPIDLWIQVYFHNTWNITILSIGILPPILSAINCKIGETVGGLTYFINEFIRKKKNNQIEEEDYSYRNQFNNDGYSFYDYHKTYTKKQTITEEKIDLLQTKKELLEEKKKIKDFTLKLKK